MTPADLLRATRALIDVPEKWVRGTFARNAEHQTTSSLSDDAVCFCLSGAMNRVRWRYDESFKLEYHRVVAVLPVEHESIDLFNDDPKTTHADVLAVLDEAIERAEQ